MGMRRYRSLIKINTFDIVLLGNEKKNLVLIFPVPTLLPTDHFLWAHSFSLATGNDIHPGSEMEKSPNFVSNKILDRFMGFPNQCIGILGDRGF